MEPDGRLEAPVIGSFKYYNIISVGVELRVHNPAMPLVTFE
jgi:hypothetical protein